MHRVRVLGPIFLCLLAPVALGDTPSNASRPAGVAWFDGDLPQAFAAAEEQHKSVFVYFGAVWCPPCLELKATIFRRRDFLERLALFIPVYVDADAPGAAHWADQLHVVGFPTALILRSDRSELERVSGGMDLSRYADILDRGLSHERPAAELLASLGEDAAPLRLEECRLLAYNDWALTDAWNSPEEHPGWLAKTAEDLHRSAARCPANAPIERARLRIVAANATLDAESKDIEAGKPPSSTLAADVADVRSILADPKLSADVADALAHLPDSFFKVVAKSDPTDRARFKERWTSVMTGLERDQRYSQATRFIALKAKLAAVKALSPSGRIPSALVRDAQRRIDAALATQHEPYARAALVNSVEWILEVIGDKARTRALLESEIRTSKTPYYYMSDLAELEEDEGHRDAALEWFARAYHESSGQATRVRWGMTYVRALIRLAPADDDRIRTAALEVLGDLERGDMIHGGSSHLLKRFAGTLKDWNKDGAHVGAVSAIRERLRGICGDLPAADPGSDACGLFLSSV